MSDLYARFRNDTKFYALVEQLVHMLECNICDYHTLQEASVFASVRHMQIHGSPVSPLMLDLLRNKGDLKWD